VIRISLLVILASLTAACNQDSVPSSQAIPVDDSIKPVEVEVTEGTNMAIAASPDGKNLVASLQGTLFKLSSAGGPAVAITDIYFDAREPDWSKDGSRLIFQGYRHGTWDLWQMNADGSQPVALTNDVFDDREPAYSPVSVGIAFSSDRGGNYDIWTVAGGLFEQLTTSDEDEHSPAWSPDGSRIAFAANRGAGQYEIRLLTIASKEVQTLVSEQGTMSGLSWRPDGTGISYRLLSRQGGLSSRLHLVDIDSGTKRILSAENADVFPFRAAWTDKNTLIYTASGEIRRLVLGETEHTIPFSATFQLNRESYQRRARRYDDSPRRALGLANPVISNTGKHVAFTALGDLWLLDRGAGTTRNLTDDPFADQTPVFSPDETKLAFVSDRTGTPLVWISNLQTGKTEPLAAQINLSGMSWSPDGHHLAGFGQIPGNPLGGQLMRIEVKTGEIETLYRPIPAQRTSWSDDGTYLATAVLAPYSSRYREGIYVLLMLDTTTGEATTLSPNEHQDMFDATLLGDGYFSYVQGGVLWKADTESANAPAKVTDILTDSPSWSSNGDHLVFMSGKKLMYMDEVTRQTTDITPELHYRRDTPTDHWVLRAGRLFDGVSPEYQRDVDVTIHGNRIISIGPRAEHNIEVVDMSDKTVMPGMFEMHAHTGGTSEAQGRTWLAYGVTSVRDPGSDPYIAKERQEAWDSGRRIGPRTHITGYLMDGNRVYYSIAEGLVSAEHIELALQRTRELELDFIKTYVRLPDEWQKHVVDAAHDMGIPTSSHELFPAAGIGMDHVEHIGGTSRRGYQPKVSQTGFVYGDVIGLLAGSGMGITPTVVLPAFSLIVSEDDDYFNTVQFETFYGEQAKTRYEMFAARAGASVTSAAKANGEALRDLVDAGALVVTGTDSPFVPYGAGLHAELRLFVRAGLTPFETLRAATFSSATAAGVIADTGTLEDGKLADIVVIDGDPLTDIRDADNVVMTVKNGRAYSLQALLSQPE
jgi:Tol biopolymer transport system component/imidazolonepropionase-like amidohydrolase|tara:strand:+ start:3737 stop:6694 length:2958 start_codon:yes stop_codon:yes gene_type:complete